VLVADSVADANPVQLDPDHDPRLKNLHITNFLYDGKYDEYIEIRAAFSS
jgi:hypothetical protein